MRERYSTIFLMIDIMNNVLMYNLLNDWLLPHYLYAHVLVIVEIIFSKL